MFDVRSDVEYLVCCICQVFCLHYPCGVKKLLRVVYSPWRGGGKMASDRVTMGCTLLGTRGCVGTVGYLSRLLSQYLRRGTAGLRDLTYLPYVTTLFSQPIPNLNGGLLLFVVYFS